MARNKTSTRLRRAVCLFVWAIALSAGLSCHAQILQGKWVDASEAAIDKHRKTDVAVIVLDADDRAVQGVKVELEQLRHGFVVGLTIPAGRMPPESLETLPVYRCFNALSMDRINDWSVKVASAQPAGSAVHRRWGDAVKPIRTAFGRVVSADPAMNADELSLLPPKDLHDVLMARVDYATGLSPGPDSFDLYSDLTHQNMLERKLGHGMVHRLFEAARARRPDARLALRVRDAITLGRGRGMVRTIQKLEVRQVPFDAVTIEQRFNGQVNPHALARMLEDTVGKLGVPVTLAGLEVGGPTPLAAALNMETVLRLAFAQPTIDGIYLAGLTARDVLEPNAALIDPDGAATPAGKVLDALFQDHWWTHAELKTDERGNASARVFTGWYRVTATLPNGKHVSTRAYIPKSDRARLIVLQATTLEAGGGG